MIWIPLTSTAKEKTMGRSYNVV